MKRLISFFVLFSLFFCKSYSQEVVNIYSKKFIEKDVRLSKKIKADHIESDSLILRNDGSYENFYSYSFFDEFGDSRIIGTYEFLNNEIVLYPQKEFNKMNKKGEDVSGSFPIHCQIINDNKINCNKIYRKIKFLERIYISN